MATSYYFGEHQRVGLLRGREKMVYWCMPLFLPYFLSSFYHFLYFTPFLFLLLVSYYFLAMDCPPFGLFFSWVLLSGWLSLSKCLPPTRSCLSAMVTSSFYNELIQCDFSLLLLGLHQLFLVCCGHPFRTIHQPIGCLDHCYYTEYVNYTITHFMRKFHFVCSCCIPLPLGSNG